jgi:sirohydrochlorin ferrochelatase
MKAILLIDHGSTRSEANAMLQEFADLLRSMVGAAAVIHIAHMELAPPDIAQGFAACVRDGATEVVVFPYMLSPGKHSTTDIPRMVAAVASKHSGVSYTITAPFGVERELGDVILRRAGLPRAGKASPATERR